MSKPKRKPSRTAVPEEAGASSLKKPVLGGALLLALLGLIANLDGALSFGERVLNWIGVIEKPSARPAIPEDIRSETGQLSLVNLEGLPGLERGTPQKIGVNLVTVEAILQNTGSSTVWATVRTAEAHLGTDECAKDNVVWDKLPIPPGISVSLAACNIETRIEPGDRKDGRVQLEIPYGLASENLDQTMRISGSLSVIAKDKGGRLLWVPDGDSARPSAAAPKVALVRPGQAPLDAAVSSELVSENQSR